MTLFVSEGIVMFELYEVGIPSVKLQSLEVKVFGHGWIAGK